jgi:hypothetical protein
VASGNGIRRRPVFPLLPTRPRAGFIKVFEKMAKFDMMNQFVTHTGGVSEGGFIGQRLFDKS